MSEKMSEKSVKLVCEAAVIVALAWAVGKAYEAT